MLKNKNLLLIFVLGIIFLIPSVLGAAEFPTWQKGISYVTWSKEAYGTTASDESLQQARSLGVEWISILTTWYQDKYNSTEIKPIVKSPSDTSLIHAIRKAHELGMKVMLKPHVDLIDTSDGKWRGGIEFATDQEWEQWFKNYTDFILHYAEIAKDENVELFCIGTELTRPAINQPQRWRDLIKKVREAYPGYLTYAANWYEEYFRVEFWDALDYVGIDPYFPLIEEDKPTLEELKQAWKVWENLLEEFQKKTNKPIIFPEIGYKSCARTADQPWLSMPERQVDVQLQADCYTALLEIFWNKPWFYGLYWWYWGTSPKMGGEFNRGFSPQNKPAQDLIKQWFSKPVPHT